MKRGWKDIYIYICCKTDDLTSIRMLSTNKHFYSAFYFKVVFDNKYPLLSAYKVNDENWIKFYKRIYCILQLQKSGYIYTSSQDVDPEDNYLSCRQFQQLTYNEKVIIYKFLKKNTYKSLYYYL